MSIMLLNEIANSLKTYLPDHQPIEIIFEDYDYDNVLSSFEWQKRHPAGGVSSYIEVLHGRPRTFSFHGRGIKMTVTRRNQYEVIERLQKRTGGDKEEH